MVAIDGKTAVDAAHIHQFKRGGPDHPTNGIAFSKTAHWLFERGFWSISDDFRVLVRGPDIARKPVTRGIYSSRARAGRFSCRPTGANGPIVSSWRGTGRRMGLGRRRLRLAQALAHTAASSYHLAMSYTGTVKNGVVVLPPEAELPDGAQVEVTLLAARAGDPPFLQAILKLAKPRDWPADFALNHAHYAKGHPKQS